MSVRRASKSSISTTDRGKGSNLIAGYSPAVDEMDLIERVTVGAGGTGAITFSSIPQTYQHLHIRALLQSNRGTYATDNTLIRVQQDSTANYANHYLRSDGAATLTEGTTGETSSYAVASIGTTQQASNFGATLIDVLDYANGTKYKVLRNYGGKDNNGTYAGYGGYVFFASALYVASTNAITSVTLIAQNGDLQQYSTASLYGVVG